MTAPEHREDAGDQEQQPESTDQGHQTRPEERPEQLTEVRCDVHDPEVAGVVLRTRKQIRR